MTNASRVKALDGDRAVKVRRALISVSDKTGLIELAQALDRHGIEIVSTGGTAEALGQGGVRVREIADLTGFPEMMDGRLKTLHPRVHGGLLAVRGDPRHEAAMAGHGIEPIDLLVVNLYPFEAAVAAGRPFADCVEMIDIGGPAMIRAAAKNHASVAVVVDPLDYAALVAELDSHAGALTGAMRRRLAREAFALTAAYDAAIAGYLQRADGVEAPRRLTLAGALRQRLRYGENPHQWGALYTLPATSGPSVAGARQVQGKELSYNNLLDTDAALALVAELDPDTAAAVAIIKHATPCGVALAGSLVEAYRRALRTDPVSAFGGIVALNRTLDGPAAEEIVKVFTEVIVAPAATDEALAAIARRPNLRLLLTGGLPQPDAQGIVLRAVSGGFLAQSPDARSLDEGDLKVVTRRAPSAGELADLQLAFTVAKHVRSNAIVYVRNRATAGIGAGQMSRVDATRIAAMKAAEAAAAAGLPDPLTRGSVVASDAFFPFPDGLLAAAEAGATAVIQPGGSVNDDKVIAAADERGLAMVFAGIRHFRH